MNKNNIFIIISLSISMAIYGCKSITRSERPAIKINSFQMSLQEFEEEFKKAPASRFGPNQRGKFLENLINQKLILQKAENMGLNKDKEFLRAIERFYEQSLFKIVIDKKSNEFASKIQVYDNEIETYYNEMVKKGLIKKSLSEVYKEIKLHLLRGKQKEAFRSWIEELREKAKIEIDKKALGIED